MSKRRLGNLLKRKFLFFSKSWGASEMTNVSEIKASEFTKGQFKDISRLGGELIVMKMAGR